jgi:hypothetical protein
MIGTKSMAHKPLSNVRSSFVQLDSSSDEDW